MPLAPDFACRLSTCDLRRQPWTFSFTERPSGGLAEVGGGYVPERLTGLGTDAFPGCAGLPDAEPAGQIIALFAGDAASEAELRSIATPADRG